MVIYRRKFQLFIFLGRRIRVFLLLYNLWQNLRRRRQITIQPIIGIMTDNKLMVPFHRKKKSDDVIVINVYGGDDLFIVQVPRL